MISMWDNIGGVQTRELCFIWGFLAHFPEEPAFRIRLMSRDIQRSFRRFEALDDTQTGFIYGALGFFRVFESDAHLVTKLWTFIFL